MGIAGILFPSGFPSDLEIGILRLFWMKVTSKKFFSLNMFFGM